MQPFVFEESECVTWRKTFISMNILKLEKQKNETKKSSLEAPGIDPGTSRMLSERSTI
jgi:hypothetical protein